MSATKFASFAQYVRRGIDKYSAPEILPRPLHQTNLRRNRRLQLLVGRLNLGFLLKAHHMEPDCRINLEACRRWEPLLAVALAQLRKIHQRTSGRRDLDGEWMC